MATDETPAPVEHLEIQVGPHTYDALACGPADGEFVLLLHGWPEFADSWSAVLPALGAAGYRAVAVDQRGYSPRARPPRIADYAVPELVADALAFADSQGAGRFHLVSHDWGGMVAWALAYAHPERLKSLTVLATPHPDALNRAAAEDSVQHHRLDYVRFFRRDDGAAEAALLADDAARLRAAYAYKVPAELVDGNVHAALRPGRTHRHAQLVPRPRVGHLGTRGPDHRAHPLPVGQRGHRPGPWRGRVHGEWVDGPYRFEALEGASHWLPEEVPDVVTPKILDHLGQYA